MTCSPLLHNSSHLLFSLLTRMFSVDYSMDRRLERQTQSPLSVCWCDCLSIYRTRRGHSCGNDVVWYRFAVDPSWHVNSRKMAEYMLDMCLIQPIRTLLFALHSSPRIQAPNLHPPKSTVALYWRISTQPLCYWNWWKERWDIKAVIRRMRWIKIDEK